MRFPFTKSAKKASSPLPSVLSDVNDANKPLPVEDAPATADVKKSRSLERLVRDIEGGESPSMYEEELQDLGRNGTPEQVERMAKHSMGWQEKHPLKEGCMSAWRSGNRANMQAFVRGYAALKSSTDVKETIDQGYINLLLKPLLALMAETGYKKNIVDDYFARIGSTSTLHYLMLLTLRQGTMGGLDHDGIDALVAAGAGLTRDGLARPLANALQQDDMKTAKHLVLVHGADIAAARESAKLYMKGKDLSSYFDLLEVTCLAAQAPETYAAGAAEIYARPLSAAVRDLMLHQMKTAWDAGDTAPYCAAMTGIIAANRAAENMRKLPEHLPPAFSKPVLTLMQDSEDAAATLETLLHGMRAKDQRLACNLLLRQVSAATGDVETANLLISYGAEPTFMNNRPLVNAIGNGHTALALELIRTHGANIGDAILDTQLNEPKNTDLLQKLFTTMALLQSTSATQAAPSASLLRLKNKQ